MRHAFQIYNGCKVVGLVIALFTVLIEPSTIQAHGTSNLNGSMLILPSNAKPGSTVEFVIQLHELEPGALNTVERVIARVGQGFENPLVTLTPKGSGLFTTSLILEKGKYNVRVILDRQGDIEEIGMNGFVTTPGGIILAESDKEIWFVPKGQYEPVPWVEHLSGVVFGLLCLLAIWRLLYSSNRTDIQPVKITKPRWILPLAALAAISMPLGAFWDIAQHSETGRESLFQPPHLLIYGGILVCAGVIAYSIGWKTAESSWRRHIMRDPAAGIALIALFCQLLSAPFDEIWHSLFGLDVSIWSPPHTVLIFGGMAVCLSLSAIQASHFEPINSFCRALTLSSALLIGEVFLAEFEFPMPAWHISQFRPLWMHPLLLVNFSILVCLVTKRAIGWRYGATMTVGFFLILRLFTGFFLSWIGMKVLPIFPVWLPGLLIIGFIVDLTNQTDSRKKITKV